MRFWTVFALLPLLMLTLVFFLRPAWLPLVIPAGTLCALALFWNGFCYYESRPLLMFFLSIQMSAITLLVLGLAAARKTPRYGAFCLESLSALLFTAMCLCVPFGYMELEGRALFTLSCPPPQTAILLLLPFGAGIALSLWGARRLRRAP